MLLWAPKGPIMCLQTRNRRKMPYISAGYPPERVSLEP